MPHPRLKLWLFVGTGLYALACAPAILIAERQGGSQSWWHGTQLLATATCFVASLVFLWRTRGVSSWARPVAFTAVSMCFAWLAFVGYVLLPLDFFKD